MHPDEEKNQRRIQQLRSLKGYEHITDEEAMQIIDQLKQLAIITFHQIAREDEQQSK